MKKYIKKSVICSIFMAIIIFITGVSCAASLSIDYNNKEDINKDKFKLYAGDEVFISFVLDDDDNNDKVMAIYGNVEYDEDVLELVEYDDKEHGENPKVGEGWLAGSINEKDNTFFFYTLDENRSNTIGFIKFRVRSDISGSTETLFSAKNVTLYKKVNNSNYEEIPSTGKNLELKIKVNSKKGDIIKIASFIIVIVGITLCILVYRRWIGNEEETEELVKEDKETLNSDDSKQDNEQNSKQDKKQNSKQNNKQERKQNIKDNLKQSNEENVKIQDQKDETVEVTINKKEDIEEKLKKLTKGKEHLEKVIEKKSENNTKAEKNNVKKEVKVVEKSEEADKKKKTIRKHNTI